MIYYANGKGMITRRVHAPHESAARGMAPDESQFLVSDRVTDDARSYIADGVLADFPPQPSPESFWCWDTYRWITPFAPIRERLGAEISEEADRRDLLPIAHDGARFDADDKARSRIKGLCDRIERGDGLTSPWLGWRDFDNGMHWAELDAAGVLAELHAITRAIEDRTQALLSHAWARKEELQTLELAGLQAFDVAAGWPE